MDEHGDSILKGGKFPNVASSRKRGQKRQQDSIKIKLDNTNSILQIVQSLTPARRLWVGYSGGVDSHVLLDILAKTFQHLPEFHVGALHVHHGISEHADDWVEHCEKVCSALQVPLTVLMVDGKVREGRSPEEVAREARFQAIEQFLAEDEALVLAHHEEDQAETILLRLFRGTGPYGLGGIPEKSKVGKGELIRPFLKISKEEILSYAKEHHLAWIEDESNHNTRFDRNFLRHEIMPVIAARWPRVVRSVGRAGALCFETATAVQVMAKQDLECVKGKEDTLSVSALLNLDLARRRGVIRYWLQGLGFALPSRDHMERIDREVLRAKPGSKPKLKISEYEIWREKDSLKVLDLVVSDSEVQL